MTNDITEIHVRRIDNELVSSALAVLRQVEDNIDLHPDVAVQAGYVFDRKEELSTSDFFNPNPSYCRPGSDDIIIRFTVIVPRYMCSAETEKFISDVVSHEEVKREAERQKQREDIEARIAQLQQELEQIA